MRKREILLVDDDHVINLVHQRMIKKNFPSLKLVVHTSARGCLDYVMLNPKTCFLLFLDIHMPQMGGWEFIDELLRMDLTDRVHVFIVSSSIDPRDVGRAKGIDIVHDYLPKPLSREILQEIKVDLSF
ncbi:response regulator [Echinicola vietnamensis]|uniref:Response regulator containing a CheY-like receiver domain and an HD-GYP domain n=1 Tax=Echinicola vietnamensis (strain DSM 17526 / LMG 23754 / KMM 6221) TaxID=926556 RepID=L0G4V5_ECHVK|nr:response regulator [Echinicola vietnamensis]AGA80562.1 response regulator containing a CheY-like receiver domain and an HD-GYP domain [Echinicola vietnamensis DSM 17526]